MSLPTLDMTWVRAQFPALATPWALFDNAGGTVPARFVIDAVTDYMRTCMVQTGGSYDLSEQAARRVAAGHAAAAMLIGADPDEVVLGHSTTMNAMILARSLRRDVPPGSAVVVSDMEHEANRFPWSRLAEHGVEVRRWRFDRQSASLRIEDLEPLLDARVRLVCFTHCSNIVGDVIDVPAVTRRVHAAGARVCVDGVAFAPHRRVDVHGWDVDFYLCSLYKVFGPHIGCLYGKREHLLRAEGQYNTCVPEDGIPLKLEPGNPTHELAAAVPGIVQYLSALHDHHWPDRPDAAAKLDRGFALIEAHERRLAAPLVQWLGTHPGARLLGRAFDMPAARVPTVSFIPIGGAPADIIRSLGTHRIAIKSGTFHAVSAIRALGLSETEGVVRVSMAHYNTPAEVERLIAALDASLSQR